jgi:hypothetical protein
MVVNLLNSQVQEEYAQHLKETGNLAIVEVLADKPWGHQASAGG